MLKFVNERKTTLQKEIDRLSGQATRAGGYVLDIGEFSATDCAKFFELNSRLRVYDGDAMNGDDVSEIRQHVADTVARLDRLSAGQSPRRGRPRRENSAIVENTNAIRDECDKILTALARSLIKNV